MNVRELIAELQKCPPDMEVCIPEIDGDEWVPVLQVLHEDGATHIALMSWVEATVPAEPESHG